MLLTEHKYVLCQKSRTTDHIFTLKTLSNKYVKDKNGGKLFACFIDFKKAYDSIWHEGLFHKLHSPREIISTMCKTGQDALRKRKPCRNLFIHISNKSASNKLKNVSMESSKLLCFNGISFCSKSFKLITFPFSIASVLTLVVMGIGHEASK